jgi:hypothetical protein
VEDCARPTFNRHFIASITTSHPSCKSTNNSSITTTASPRHINLSLYTGGSPNSSYYPVVSPNTHRDG